MLKIAARKIIELLPVEQLHIVTPDKDCREMETALRGLAVVHPEDGFLPGVTIERLRQLPIQGFPAAAGWYFQQLLKLQFACVNTGEDHYLIWDADTIPLRPMKFFDEDGRMLLTRADEHHPAYFETYRTILGEDPKRECSFIAQHMIVQKSVAREMFARIESHLPGEGSWAWKLMAALPSKGFNLFSEYETYGHYVRSHHPGRVAVVSRSWRRDGAVMSGGGLPSERLLDQMSNENDFVAFERVERRWWRRWARRFQTGITELAGRSRTALGGSAS